LNEIIEYCDAHPGVNSAIKELAKVARDITLPLLKTSWGSQESKDEIEAINGIIDELQ
jgi:hypothetical protein